LLQYKTAKSKSFFFKTTIYNLYVLAQ